MNRKKILMNEKHILRLVMLSAGETIKSVAEKVGIKGVALSNQLSRPDSTMTLTSVYTLLDAMGYEIVVRKKKANKDDPEYVLSEIDSADDTEWRKKVAIAKADEEVRRIEMESEKCSAIRSEMKPPSSKRTAH